jgi:putative intracellular protease/amidase
MAPVFNVAVFLYSGADILDFCGPIEIYSTSPPSGAAVPFTVTTFGFEERIKDATNTLTLVPEATFQDVSSNLDNYDILLFPGSWPDVLSPLLESENGKALLDMIRNFARLKPREETGHRIVQSVCTGALILAASGILAGKTVTTHHLGYDILKEFADKAAGGESNIKVVRKRWVDAGFTDAGVRIINAGGVTSGIDTSLFISEVLIGKEWADHVADVVEFERRKQDDGWGA